MQTENEYVLGTHDQEIARLGVQHCAWRTRALAAWERAGIGPSQTILDVGCGPGYASLDLAEIAGPSGHVVAIDKSERFLYVLASRGMQRDLHNIMTQRVDLEAGEFAQIHADHIWCRWVLCFLKNARDVVAQMAAALKPGGSMILHEYFDYATWRAAPSCPELDEYVRAVMDSWHANGGEPDISVQLPCWLEELGFELRHTRPLLEIVESDSMLWAWLRTFINVGRERLVELGCITRGDADRIWNAFIAFEAKPGSRMFTPAMLEIIARR
ncbi:MAG: methyltransferase domain-containing protein [Acidobacteriia bacterium]|nr:methyltransferase domain-containing protein [Terriglobia bacterium]